MSKTLVEHQNGLLHIKLNNPTKHNALDEELMLEITEHLNQVKDLNHSHKAVLISGEGKSLCAGADLNWMKQMVNYSLEENIKDSEKLFNLFDSIYSCPLPVVVKAHGHVFGGGLGLLAAADFVVAEENTKFCFSEVKLGLAPAVISSFINSKCDSSLAQAYMISGMVFSNEVALRMGLVNSKADELDAVITSYLSAGTDALVATKKLCLEQRSIHPQDFKDSTIETISKLRISSEAQKRMNHFLEKKK